MRVARLAVAASFLALASGSAEASSFDFSDQLPEYCQVMVSPNPLAEVVKLREPSAEGICSIEQLVERLLSANGTEGKSEFETSAEYQARLAGARDIELFPGHFASKQFAIIARVPASRIKYDADTQTFGLSYPSQYLGVLGNLVNATGESNSKRGSYDTMIPFNKKMETTHYDGRNSFGTTVDIRREEGNAWGVLPDPLWRGLPVRNEKSAKISVSLADAPNVKGNLAFILVGMVASDPVAELYDGHRPKIDSPWDLSMCAFR